MSYTVYFTHKRPFTTGEWGKIIAAVTPMFHRLKQIKSGNGTGRPFISNDEINFNGDASKGEDHENLVLCKNGSGFQFCKTARKPYDRYVKAVLVVAFNVAPGALEVSCDGDTEDGCWDEGVRIANLYLNDLVHPACSPLEKAKHDKMTESAIAASEDFQARGLKYPKDAFNELEEAIELWVKLSGQNKVHAFLANYLKANIDDLKEAYTP